MGGEDVPMDKYPNIPMRPEDLPQQRLHLVEGLPERRGFHARCDYTDPLPARKQPGEPQAPVYLGMVEWAWSPMHSRIDSYYLDQNKEYWFLWNLYDDACEHGWTWVLYAYGEWVDIAPETAATYLLLDAWKAEAKENELDKYHWIDEEGMFSVSQFSAIARSVWGKEG
jgi:hypothetical protein